MKSTLSIVLAVAVLGVSVATAQPNPGAMLQAAQDPGYAAAIAMCKNPPPPAAPRPATPPGGNPAGPPGSPLPPKDYTVAQIRGVVAAGARWRRVYQQDGNVIDGIVGTDDGAVLAAQNDKGQIVKIAADGKVSVVFRDLRTSGSLSRNKNGALFATERALNPAIVQLEPTRKVLANKIGDDPLHCVGGVLNDLTAASNGGVYFTAGGLFYAAPNGSVTRYGENLRTNGIVLSPDEKTLYVTNGPTLAAFDVQPDGSLKNQREFAKLAAGGDGATVDAQGRIYVTGGGINVIGADGKVLGLIPTPFTAISVAFSGKDKKTLFAVGTLRENGKQSAELYAIDLQAQGYEGRAK
jgi:gluconolactonase